MLTLPNIEDAPTFDFFAVRDSADYAAMAQDASGTGVLNGCQVSQHTGSDMLCTVSAGTFYIDGIENVLAGPGQVTVSTPGATDRRDSVVAALNGTLNATHTNGGGAITSITVIALPVAIPSGSTLVMPNGDQAITSALASLGATTVSINSYTPTSTITSGQPFTPLWVLAGTVCGTSGWTQSSAGNPPVKSLNGAGTLMLGEVGVPSTLTVVVNADIVDKTGGALLAGQLAGTINGNSQAIVNLSQLLFGEASTSNYVLGMESAQTLSPVVTVGQLAASINVNDSITFTTNAPSASSSIINITSTWAGVFNTFGSFNGMTFAPTFTPNTGHAPATVGGFVAKPKATGAASSGSFIGMGSTPVDSTTSGWPTTYGLVLGANAGGSATAVGLSIGISPVTGLGSLSGGTIWAMQIANYQSYFNGKVTFGATGAPVTAIDLQATGGDTGAIQFAPQASNPSNPTSSGPMKMYFKGTKVVFQYNDAGTVRYFTADLNQTLGTAVWANSTTAP